MAYLEKWSLAVGLWMLGATGCMIPHGSNARPVQPLEAGTLLVGANVVMPVAVVGDVVVDEVYVQEGLVADDLSIVPGGSFDVSLDNTATLGMALSYVDLRLPTSKRHVTRALRRSYLVMSPRIELPISAHPRLSITGELNTALLVAKPDSDPQFGGPASFFMLPTVGARYYLPIGDGGLVVSQSIGLGASLLPSFVLSGSAAYDIAIGDLHIMPELKWDPSVGFRLIDDQAGVPVNGSWFSGALSVMYAL